MGETKEMQNYPILRQARPDKGRIDSEINGFKFGYSGSYPLASPLSGPPLNKGQVLRAR